VQTGADRDEIAFIGYARLTLVATTDKQSGGLNVKKKTSANSQIPHKQSPFPSFIGRSVIWLCVVALAELAFGGIAIAQNLGPVAGNHADYIGSSFTSELPDSQPLKMEALLALRNRDQLNQFEADLQNRDSPNYGKWLTPEQFAARFGPTPQQMQAVANWLGSQGLTVTAIDSRSRAIKFNAPYATVKAALQTTIVSDGRSYINTSDPMVPATLAPTITAIEGLSGSIAKSGTASSGIADAIVPHAIPTEGPFFAPSDFYSYYDENPVLNSGNHGTGGRGSSADCIAMPELGSVTTQALDNFVARFHLPPIKLTTIVVNDANPGLPSDNEPYLDIEWAHAVSPNTPIVVYLTQDNSGGYVAALQQAVSDNSCGVITSSTEDPCSKGNQPSTIAALDEIAAQGVAQGQTIFHSSGDYGANWKCGSPAAKFPNQQSYQQSQCAAASASATPAPDSTANIQPSVDEEATSPNITVVGGTQFAPNYNSRAQNTSTLNDDPPEGEIAWNANDPTPTPAATPTPFMQNCPIKDSSGGGPSVIFAKPSWQAGPGVPNDGARDVPDVSFGANGTAVGAPVSPPMPGFFVSSQRAGDTKPFFTDTGGTSIASPMWAGVSRLIAAEEGVTRMGNINARLYELGNLQNPATGLHDVTEGNNDDGGVTGFEAGPGYDLVTGWGSADIAKLVAAFPGAAAAAMPVSTVVSAGAGAAAGSFTITNTTAGSLAVTAVKVTLSRPSIFSSLTLTATIGEGTPTVANATPDTSAVFSFSPALNVPSGGVASFVLQGGSATTRVASIPIWLGPMIGGSDNRDDRAFDGVATILSIGLAFASFFVAARGRKPVTIAGLILMSAIVMSVSSCGGGSGGSAAASSSTVSQQTLGQGSIALNDGQGGNVLVSGLPASLGSVAVHF
jgi:subtilase family serine protease